MTQLANVLKVISGRPWSITQDGIDQITSIIELRVLGIRPSDAEVAARLAEADGARAADQRRGRRRSGAVAVIPIYGPIVPKASLFSAMSGATSLSQLRADVQDALDDEDVASILLDIDSPGGVVDGVPEMAAFLRQAREEKPVLALANTVAASAAYWLAAQASEISVTTSGIAGSIGVFLQHVEFSKADEEAGIKTTIIRAGKYKAEANDAEPLTDEARDHLQEEVDYYYTMFVKDVAAGRGVKVSAVREGYGQGRVLNAQPALAAGLVDRIETYDQAAARLVKGGGKLGRPTSLALIEDRPAAITDRQGELEEQEAEDPDHDDGSQVDDQEETEATGPTPEYYALRARRRDRAR